MNCRQVASRLYEYLDGELTPEMAARIRDHLADCAPCFSRFSFEEAFLRVLQARNAGRGAPPDLRRRILDRLLLGPEGLEADDT